MGRQGWYWRRQDDLALYNNQLDKHEGYHKGTMRILTWGIYNEGYRNDVGQQVSEVAIAIGGQCAMIHRHVVLSMNLNCICYTQNLSSIIIINYYNIKTLLSILSILVGLSLSHVITVSSCPLSLRYPVFLSVYCCIIQSSIPLCMFNLSHSDSNKCWMLRNRAISGSESSFFNQSLCCDRVGKSPWSSSHRDARMSSPLVNMLACNNNWDNLMHVLHVSATTKNLSLYREGSIQVLQ